MIPIQDERFETGHTDRVSQGDGIEDDGPYLYLDCSSGISGDMFVAALLDLGVDRRIMDRALRSLPLTGFRYEVTVFRRPGLEACDFNVITGPEANPGTLCRRRLAEPKDDRHSEIRGLPDVERVIKAAECSTGAKELALRIFGIIAEAEAEAHGVRLDEVHFHEVGAVDSIVDVLSAAVCMDALGVRRVIITELWEGSGSVECEHGILPVPVPAVSIIARDHGLPLRRLDHEGEHVTPTGAAIAAAIRTDDELPDSYSVESSGIGVGKRYRERSSVLRAMLIN